MIPRDSQPTPDFDDDAHDADGPASRFINVPGRPISPLDLAMAEDPARAAAEFILNAARPNVRGAGKTGPKTAEGKARSSRNSITHGCCRGKRDPNEEIEYQIIHQGLCDEFHPASPEEIAAVERMAEARFRWNKCQRALDGLKEMTTERHRAKLRGPLEERIRELESSLEIWEKLPGKRFPFGKGFGGAYEILLKDLDPRSPKNSLNSPKAREFAFHHSLVQASSELLALHKKLARERQLKPHENRDHAVYQHGSERIADEFQGLTNWVQKHVRELRALLQKTKCDLARVDSDPVDDDTIELMSDEYRKLNRYLQEADTTYARNRKVFHSIRQHLFTVYDQQMQHIQSKYPVMFKVGPLGIHLPRELGSICGYDQIEAIVKILVSEQKYYSPSSRNECRETARKAKPYENTLLASIDKYDVQTHDGVTKRVPGTEESLRPAAPPPLPPNGAGPPR